jgi:CheY-like chemotaxis protein/predicted transcriptional regulator
MPIKILLVDDDADLLEELETALRQFGHEVIALTNAQSALDAIGRERTTKWIALLDIRMPGVDGFTLANILSDWSKIDLSVKIIFLTGSISTDVALRAVRIHAFDLLEKPISLDRLSESVSRAVAQIIEEGRSYSGSPIIDERTSIPVISCFKANLKDTLAIEMEEIKLRLALPSELHEEDCWGMFLDLFKAGIDGELVPAANLYYNPKLTTSTALRRIASLIDLGLVAKFSDTNDARRVLLGITEKGMNLLTEYFDTLSTIELKSLSGD